MYAIIDSVLLRVFNSIGNPEVCALFSLLANGGCRNRFSPPNWRPSMDASIDSAC
jgi:hypothetical protein